MRGFLFINVFITMKYILKESRLNRAMIKFFQKELNLDEIKSHNPIEEDPNGEEYEDTNKTIYYIGDLWDDDEELFRYYKCEYFYENSSEMRKKCPILVMDDRILNTFNGMFDDLWVEPFKQWINNELDLNVKSIE